VERFNAFAIRHSGLQAAAQAVAKVLDLDQDTARDVMDALANCRPIKIQGLDRHRFSQLQRILDVAGVTTPE
jgi:hypothetical protein